MVDKTKAVEAKAADTRQAGCFEVEVSEEGFPLDKLLLFISDMFPNVAHENIFFLPAEEGKVCVATTQPVSTN